MQGGRRAGDAAGMPVRDRLRRAVIVWGRLVWGTLVIVIAVFTLLRLDASEDRSSERDAARAYQRCEQIAPAIVIEQIALERAPGLRAEIQRREPGLLSPDGKLEVPDCEAIYPRGAKVSGRYPDLTPTKDIAP